MVQRRLAADPAIAPASSGLEHVVLVMMENRSFDHLIGWAPGANASAAAGDRDGRLGFRTPALLVAPWAQAGTISHVTFDHTSVLRLIEWRWGLPPLTVRDATANNLALALDFNHPRGGRPPPFAVAPQLVGAPCLPPLPTSHEIGLSALAALARGFGWKIPP